MNGRDMPTYKPPHREDFMALLRLHEQCWGRVQYEDRPSLADLLRAPVVVFWLPADDPYSLRYTATTHLDLLELRKYVSRLVLHSLIELPRRRIAHIFVRRQPVRITGVRLMLEGLE